MGHWFSRNKAKNSVSNGKPKRHQKVKDFEAVADEYLKKQSVRSVNVEPHTDDVPQPDPDPDPPFIRHVENGVLDDGYYTPAEQSQFEVAPFRPSDIDARDLEIRWQRGGLIGSGGFGKVFLGLNLDSGELLAVKQITIMVNDQCQKEIESFKQEVAVMKGLQHENIVRYLGMSTERETLNIFMECIPGSGDIPSGSLCSLSHKFGRFSEPVIKVYTRQILLGLHYLHNHHIIHRDIKGANILVDNTGIVKLTDFGASKRLEGMTQAEFCSLKGTPHWMAPEVIKQTGHGRQADIWSLGCTVIEMATGRPPWSEIKDQVSVLFHIANTEELPPLPRDLSAEAQDFLKLCLTRRPQRRPNSSRLFSHAFVASHQPSTLATPMLMRPEARTESSHSSPTNMGWPDDNPNVLENPVEEPTWGWHDTKRNYVDGRIIDSRQRHNSFSVPNDTRHDTRSRHTRRFSENIRTSKVGPDPAEIHLPLEQYQDMVDRDTIQNYLRESTIKETGRLMTPEQKTRILESRHGRRQRTQSRTNIVVEPESIWNSRTRKEWEVALERELEAEVEGIW